MEDFLNKAERRSRQPLSLLFKTEITFLIGIMPLPGRRRAQVVDQRVAEGQVF